MDAFFAGVSWAALVAVLVCVAVLTIAFSYDRGREVARRVWRSRTLRLTFYAALAFLALKLAASSGLFPVSVLGQVDPILYQSAGLRIAFCIVAAIAMLNVLAAFDNSAGISFRKDVLPELVTGNLAIAVYFGARILAVAIVMGCALG